MVKLRTLDQKTIRAENRKKILQLLIKRRELTIPEISREIEVSVPTVTKNINQLVADGIAEEAGISESTGGRKPMMIRFLPDAYHSLGVEFSVDYVRVILTNLDSQIKADRALRNPDFKEIDGVMRDVQEEIKSILLEKEIPATKVLGIGFSLPGTVNEETRVLGIAPNLGLKHVDFNRYEPIFDFPIFVENDANASAMAELTLDVTKTLDNLVYVEVLMKGIGAGIIVEGHLYRGKNKRAGILGHITVASQGKQCACGMKDCWELYASAGVLLAEYQRKTGKQLADLYAFFAALQCFDPKAAEVFDTYLDYLALGIKDIILIQDPDYVIIGGVMSPFEEIFLEPLKQRIFIENSFYNPVDVHIMGSILKEDAAVLGASLLPFERVFSQESV